MLVDVGEKVHVIERRLFDNDVRRHFFGEVDRSESHAIRLTGYAFVFDTGSNTYIRSTTMRTRVIPIGAVGHVINIRSAPHGDRYRQI